MPMAYNRPIDSSLEHERLTINQMYQTKHIQFPKNDTDTEPINWLYNKVINFKKGHKTTLGN